MIPQGSYIEVENDFKFHYYDEGDGDVVVLLHGSGTGASGHTNFKNNFKALKEAGIELFCQTFLDMVFLANQKMKFTYWTILNTKLVQLLDALKIESFSLIGNSLGGALALGLALSHPKRVEKLILMAPGGVEDQDTYNKNAGHGETSC